MCYLVDLMAPEVVNHTYEAPQANLVFLITQGVVGGKLPWVPVIIGMCIAACVEMMGIGGSFAVGLYLPLELTTTLVFGGLIHWYFHKAYPEKRHKTLYDHGLLVCSGLVAGDALVGVLIVVLTKNKVNLAVTSWALKDAQWFSCLCFSLLCVYLFWEVRKAARQGVVPAVGGRVPGEGRTRRRRVLNSNLRRIFAFRGFGCAQHPALSKIPSSPPVPLPSQASLQPG